MRSLFYVVFSILPTALFAGSWQDLIQGDSLAQWASDPDHGHWSVEAGVITGKSDPEQRGSMLWTRGEFGDFVFETEFKFVDFVDSGIKLKGGNGIQVNLGNSISQRVNRTASIFAPQEGKERFPAIAENAHEIMVPNGWNIIRIHCEGKRIMIMLNGREVVDYTSTTLPEKGPIGLQVHGNLDMEIHFRNTRILEK